MLRDGGSYRDQRFDGIQLSGTLRGAVFHDCVFEAGKLRELRMEGCRFVDSDFLGCDLSLISVKDCIFQGVTIEHCEVLGVDWSVAKGDLLHPFEVDFKASAMGLTTFERMVLRGRRFEGCQLHEARFSGCDLRDTRFRGSDLAGCLFEDCDLGGADLRKATGYRLDLRRNKVHGLRVLAAEAPGLLDGWGIQIDEA